jgi:proline racemase
MWWRDVDGAEFERRAEQWVASRPQSVLRVADSHTAGNPTRIVLGGVTPPEGVREVLDVRQWLRSEADFVRTRLNHEPRGGALTCAVLPLPPVDDSHDLGAVIMEPGSYPPMCGHCMIGLASVVADLDMVPGTTLPDNRRRLRILTPAGIVVAEVHQREGHSSVSLTNVDSYVVDTWTETLDDKKVTVDLLYGGDYYPTIDVAELGITVDRADADTIVRLARGLSGKLAQREIRDPLTGEVLDVYQVMFHQPASDGAAASRIAVVAPPGVIDRSPCGTGSSALLALRLTRGELTPDQTMVTNSIIDSQFAVRAANVSIRDGRTYVSPVLTGSAFIDGFATVVTDPLDDLADGFAPL